MYRYILEIAFEDKRFGNKTTMVFARYRQEVEAESDWEAVIQVMQNPHPEYDPEIHTLAKIIVVRIGEVGNAG